MSRYSDKSDFADTCEMHNSLDAVAKAKIFYDDIELKINSPRDLIPYFPHIVASMGSSKETGMCINLSKYSQPRHREMDTIGIYINDYVRRAKRAKRKKEELKFEPDSAFTSSHKADTYNIFKRCEDYKSILIKHWTLDAFYDRRYNEQALNQFLIERYFSDIHTCTGDFYRRNLLDEASKYFGIPYKLDEEDYMEYMNAPHSDEDFTYNKKLIDELHAVWDYKRATAQAEKELNL